MPDPTYSSTVPITPPGPAGPQGPAGTGVDPGTTGTLAKYTGTQAIGSSIVTESGTMISIAGGLTLPSVNVLQWSTDTILQRDAANVLAMYNSTNQQTIRVYGTRSDANNYRYAALTMTTAGDLQLRSEGIGSGVSGNTFSLVMNGTNAFTVTAANTATFSGGLQSGSTSVIQWAGRSRLSSPSDGTVNMTNQAASGFTALQFSGTQILTTRRTGWTAPTGTALRTGFDTATGTLTQALQTLKALIDDLTTHGVIGT